MNWGERRSRRRPTPLYVVDHLGEAAAIAAEHGDLMVVDLENTIVDYGSTEEERLRAVTAAADEVATVAGQLARLAFITNGPFALPRLHHDSLTIHTVSAARKPYVRLAPLRHIRSLLEGAAVYGDQPLTDGMLARNLGGVWIQPRHAHEPEPAEPLWPRVMRWAGRRAMDRHFELTRRPAGHPGRRPEPQGVQAGSRPVSPSTRSNLDEAAGTATSGP